jgi:hypothetical protein
MITRRILALIGTTIAAVVLASGTASTAFAASA